MGHLRVTVGHLRVTIGYLRSTMGYLRVLKIGHLKVFCEAQGKGRARDGPRKVTQRSFMDGGWWMVDILSLMLYTKVGCHHHPPTHRTFNFT